jgi:DnaK suppressor protein
MSSSEAARYQEILTRRVVELERALCQRDGIQVERVADQLDETRQASERALVVSNLDRDCLQLREARSALSRIQDGTFGTCQRCDEGIHPKRLNAVPWASLCLYCQELADRKSKELSYGDAIADAA